MSKYRFYLVIGLPSAEPFDAVAQAISAGTGVRFEEHDSLHWGGGYFLGDRTSASRLGQNVYLYQNRDIEDDTPFFEDATDCPFLLRIDYPAVNIRYLVQRLSEVLDVPCRIVWPPDYIEPTAP